MKETLKVLGETIVVLLLAATCVAAVVGVGVILDRRDPVPTLAATCHEDEARIETRFGATCVALDDLAVIDAGAFTREGIRAMRGEDKAYAGVPLHRLTTAAYESGEGIRNFLGR